MKTIAADLWIAPAVSGATFREWTNIARPARKIFEIDL
jgi:hypothetical protein